MIRYDGYLINGVRFHTQKRDSTRCVQNSGVTLTAKTMQVSNSKDKNLIISNMSFYGVLQDIWELDYIEFKVVVFKCQWVESSSGVKEDEDGCTLVDLTKIGHKSDSFILSTHAQQVFYVEDGNDPAWSIVVPNSRHMCNGYSNDDELGDTVLEHCVIESLPDIQSFAIMDDSQLPYVRDDSEGTWIANN